MSIKVRIKMGNLQKKKRTEQ